MLRYGAEYKENVIDLKDDNCFDYVVVKPEIIRNYLYFLARVPIIDAPFRLKMNPKIRNEVPCFCPFQPMFSDLNKELGGEEFVKIFV